MAFRGVVGEVKWSYFVAAAITGYTVTRDEFGGLYLTGTVARQDAYNLAQRPLYFVAPTKRGAFRWPIETFTITPTTITARLGAIVAAPKGIAV